MTAVSDETGRQQAFERFPKLAGWIERLAGTQMDLSLTEWNEFLAELNAALSAAPVAQEPVATKKVYIKPLRTIVEIQTAYADQIRDWLNTPPPATPAGVEEDWRDDPSADERWQAGLDYGMERFCSMLGVDPKDVRWDAATEELDGDVCAVIGNILRVKFGDDFDPMKPLPSAGLEADEIARLQRCLNTLRPFTSRPIGGEGSPARLEQQDRAKAFEEATAILALLSRAGDQGNSTQKDGSR